MAADAVVAGGSVAGLASALALASAGRRVLVLDPAGPPPDGPAGKAAGAWHRPTVPHARHPHTLNSLGVSVLRAHVPDLLDALVDAGAHLVDMTLTRPGGPVESDAELVALSCRRTTFELVLHRLTATTPGVEIRYGTTVRGVQGTSRVTAAVTDRADSVGTDLLVDATGRRATSRDWLAATGWRLPPDQVRPSGLRLFSRFYRRSGPMPPLDRGNAAGVLGSHYACVLHPGDGDTFSISIGVLPEDHKMRALSRCTAFTAVATATPGVRAWLHGAEPITPVRAFTFPPNIMRGMANGDTPGVVPVGDAACVTNPLYGRGISLAFAHAFRGLTTPDPSAVYLPWFRLSVDQDRDRIAMWRTAVRSGATPPPADGVWRASRHDPLVWRGLTRVLMGLNEPGQVFDEHFHRRVRTVLAGAPPAPATPTRAELVELVEEAP